MQKKLVLGVMCFCLLSTVSFGCSKHSKGKPDQIKGAVISVDAVKNQAVIKDKYTGEEKTIVVDAKDISRLRTGSQVKIQLKPGTNNAVSIKLHSSRAKEDTGDKADKEDKEE